VCSPSRIARCAERNGRTCHINPSGRVTCRKSPVILNKRQKCPQSNIEKCKNRGGRICHVNPSGRMTCRKKQIRKKTPSPKNKTPSPQKKTPSPKRKTPSPKKKTPSPKRKTLSPQKKTPSPQKKTPSPQKKTPSPKKKTPSPKRKTPLPQKKTPSPQRKTPSPKKKIPSPQRKTVTIKKESPSPQKKTPSPQKKTPSPKRKTPSPKRKTPSPKRKTPSPKRKTPSPKRKTPSPKKKTPSPQRKTVTIKKESPSPQKTKCKTYGLGTRSRVVDKRFKDNITKYCTKMPLKDIQFLSVNFFVKLNLAGSNIYIFGEDHRLPQFCPPENSVFIDGLVSSVADEKKTEMFDFFYESEFPKLGVPPLKRDSDITNIINYKYARCIALQNRNCIHQNLRVHYIDFRQYDTTQELNTLINYLYSTIHFFNFSQTKLKTLITLIIQRFSHAKLRKQFENIANPKIKDFLIGENENIIKFLKARLSTTIKINQINILRKQISFLLDFYTLGRMLRNFGTYKAKNIIFYGGYMHSLNIERLLVKMGAKRNGKSVLFPDKSCIPFDAQKIFS